jgi:hypothetical protein
MRVHVRRLPCLETIAGGHRAPRRNAACATPTADVPTTIRARARTGSREPAAADGRIAHPASSRPRFETRRTPEETNVAGLL